MWRCITAMARADGLIHEDEVSYLNKIFSHMLERGELTAEAHEVLTNDLTTAQNPSDLLKEIKDPAYRAQIIYFSRLLAHKDGEFHPNEDLLLAKMKLDVVEGVDFTQIRKEIQNNVQKEMILQELENDAERPTEGLAGIIDRLALAFDMI